MKHKQVLVAIDGSQHSDKVVDQAIHYVKLLDAGVILIHCHRRFPAIIGEPHRSEATAAIIADAEKLIAPFAKRFEEHHIQCEVRLIEEPAASSICEVARIQHCDLIIMGSRGLTSLEGLFVGSVTTRVLHTTPCSVLVVK